MSKRPNSEYTELKLLLGNTIVASAIIDTDTLCDFIEVKMVFGKFRLCQQYQYHRFYRDLLTIPEVIHTSRSYHYVGYPNTNNHLAHERMLFHLGVCLSVHADFE